MSPRLRALPLLALSSLVTACASGATGGGSTGPAEAKPAASALKVGVHHQCLAPLAAKNDPAALVAMGIVDQTRGNLGEAKKKYMAAAGTELDVLTAPVDVTLAGGVIWVQTVPCPVPVPAAPESEAVELEKLAKSLEPIYPRVLLSVRTEGTVRASVWVGPDGKATRIHVVDTSVGPVGVSKRRDPGEEIAERMIARVQLALQAIEDLRAHEFGAGVASKRFDWKLTYIPPRDAKDSLPGRY